MSDTVKRSFWLLVSPSYSKYGSKYIDGLQLPKVASGRDGKSPNTKRGEFPIKVELELPKALFERPTYTAKISVDPNITPSQIEADVLDNVAEIASEATGFHITIDQAIPEGE